MGDGISDSVRENEAYHSFIDSIPRIEETIGNTPFYQMTRNEHHKAFLYWRHKRDELIKEISSAIHAKYDGLVDDHWDVYVGNNTRVKGWMPKSHYLPTGIKAKTLGVDGQ